MKPKGLLVLVFSISVLNAQSPPMRTPRLAIRSGLVEVQRGNAWRPASVGEFFNLGDRIRTASGSTAALEMGPSRVVTLNELSGVLIGQGADASPIVHLETGSMKVFSASDLQVSAKDTVLESSGAPVDLELGYEADKLNLTVFNGAVRNGSMIIRGGNQDPTVRSYTAGPQRNRVQTRGALFPGNQVIVADPTFYVYPYFLFGNPGTPDPNAGRIVPPVVNNPTNPGFRPTQIVPPMSDPIRVPVTKP